MQWQVLVVTAAVATTALLLFRHIRRILKNPSAPGPAIARWSDLWYISKVFQGQFEKENVKLHALHGKVVRLGPDKYSIDDPDAVKELSRLTKSEWYTGSADPRVGANDNVFSVQDRDLHQMMRKTQARFYSMGGIKSYEPYSEECIEALVKQFDRLSDSNESFDLQQWLQCFSFDTVSQMTYGHRHGLVDEGGHDPRGMMNLLWNLRHFSTYVGMGMWTLPALLLWLGLPNVKLMKHVDELNRKGEADYFSDSNVDAEKAEADYDDGRPASFLQKVMSFKRGNPIDWVKYRVHIVPAQNIFAGSDATSITLTSIVYFCSRKPAIWKRLQAELQTAIAEGKADNPVRLDQIQSPSFPYLERVVKEALRVHPAVGLPVWRLSPAGGITIADHYFPEKTWIGINPWVAHHNTTVFGPDAAEFNPDRWDPAITPKDKLSAMEAYNLSWGSGAHYCIGKNIALLEINKLIPELVRRYDFVLDEPEKPLLTENNWFVKQKSIRTKVVKRDAEKESQ